MKRVQRMPLMVRIGNTLNLMVAFVSVSVMSCQTLFNYDPKIFTLYIVTGLTGIRFLVARLKRIWSDVVTRFRRAASIPTDSMDHAHQTETYWQSPV